MIAIIVAVLATAKDGHRSAEYVFTYFESNSGWPDGWSFLVGTLHAAYATSSTGMITSMCEEVREPSTQVPKAMVLTVLINTVCGFLFLIPLVFVLPDLQDLIPLSQPVPFIIKSAVGSPGAAIALCLPLIVLGICCGIGCTTAASRCVWAFARDGAIPGSGWWKQVHPNLDVPLNAMMLSMVVQILLGLLWFGSSAAFNAFSGVGVISLTTAYASPIAISLFTGRKAMKGAKFNLGAFGVFVNVIALGTLLPLLRPWVITDDSRQPGPHSSCLCSACLPLSPSRPIQSTMPPSCSLLLSSSRLSGTPFGATVTTLAPLPKKRTKTLPTSPISSERNRSSLSTSATFVYLFFYTMNKRLFRMLSNVLPLSHGLFISLCISNIDN